MALRVTYGDPGKMNQLMQLMGYDWLSKQRHKRSLDYLQEQRRGMEEYQARGAGIEKERMFEKHKLTMAEELQKFYMDVAKEPPIKRYLATLQFMETQPGVNPKELSQLRQVIGNKAKEYAGGLTAILSKNITEVPNDLLANAIVEAGTEEVGKLGRARVSAETAEAQLGQRREELAFKERKEIRLGKEKPSELLETQNKEWITLVKDTVDFLESRGVEGSELAKADRALFSTGKYADPLSSELQGKAYTYLMEIWMKLIKRKPLSGGDELFLQKVRNTRGVVTPIEEGGYGGLPSPEAGLSEEETKRRMIEQIANDIQSRLQLEDRGRALILAEEFYNTLR